MAGSLGSMIGGLRLAPVMAQVHRLGGVRATVAVGIQGGLLFVGLFAFLQPSFARLAGRPARPAVVAGARQRPLARTRSGVHGGSKVTVTSTRSTPGIRCTTARTHSAITACRGHAAAVSVIVMCTAPASTRMP